MAKIKGTQFDDTLWGTGGADEIFGLDGHDVLKGGGGADRLDGGAGDDTVTYIDSGTGVRVDLAAGRGFGGSAEGDRYVSIESARGSFYDDVLTGSAGDNGLIGLAGRDLLDGGAGNDLLDGGEHDDILKGGGGADILIGGIGIDTADYSRAAESPEYEDFGVEVDLRIGAGLVGEAAGDTLSGIENVIGSAFGDHIQGDGQANTIRGLDGDDTLEGHEGDDALYGGDGVDFLAGGTGNNRMDGGDGDDVYFVESAGDIIIEHAGYGADKVGTMVTYSLSDDAEVEFLLAAFTFDTQPIHLGGNGFSQTLEGNNGMNVLNAFGGDDALDGHGGDDQLYGGGGVDLLNGGAGNDRFVFHPGEGHGDTIMDYAGLGDAEGDSLYFIGFGPGATFTQVDATHWQVNYNGGASHDVISFLNGGAAGVHPSDIVFL